MLERVTSDSDASGKDDDKSTADAPTDKLTSSKIGQKLGLKTAQFLDRATELGYLAADGDKHTITPKGEKAGVEFVAKSRFGPYSCGRKTSIWSDHVAAAHPPFLVLRIPLSSTPKTLPSTNYPHPPGPTLTPLPAVNCSPGALRPMGRLAEILVLDQFSRNVYRDTARAFGARTRWPCPAQELVASGQDRNPPTAAARVCLHAVYAQRIGTDPRASPGAVCAAGHGKQPGL